MSAHKTNGFFSPGAGGREKLKKLSRLKDHKAESAVYYKRVKNNKKETNAERKRRGKTHSKKKASSTTFRFRGEEK